MNSIIEKLTERRNSAAKLRDSETNRLKIAVDAGALERVPEIMENITRFIAQIGAFNSAINIVEFEFSKGDQS